MSMSSGGARCLLLTISVLVIGRSDGAAATTCPLGLSASCVGCEDGPHECLQCASGHVLNRNHTQCYACPSNCEVCLAGKDRAECQQCNLGYYRRNADMACYRCPGNCRHCVEGSHGGVCVECSDTYYGIFNIGQVKLECSLCHPDCEKCLDVDTCLECKSTYYVVNGRCDRCVSNCDKCTTASSCDTCSSGTFWDTATSACSSCSDAACLRCRTKDECTQCAKSHFLSATSTCLPKTNCIPGSGQSAVADDGCTACDAGYRVVSDKRCTLCPLRDFANCKTCQPGGRGQFWDFATLACLDCPLNCETCLSLDMCVKCVDGYYWDAAATPKQCKDCQAAPSTLPALACNLCRNRYFETDCKTCADVSTSTTSDSCLHCVSSTRGRVWTPKKCQVLACTSADINQCATCPDHYWDGSACVSCPTTATTSTVGAGKCQGHLKDLCDYVVCNGLSISTDNYVCERCLAQVWTTTANTASCKALSCLEPSGMSQTNCNACAHSSGYYYETSGCKKLVLADCPIVDVPKTGVPRAFCEACNAITSANSYVFYLDTSTGSIGKCALKKASGCTQAAGCWQCLQQDAATCATAITCNAASPTSHNADRQTCVLCGFYHDSNSNCYVCVSATKIDDDQKQCEACNYGGRTFSTDCKGGTTGSISATPPTIAFPPDTDPDPTTANCNNRRERRPSALPQVRCLTSGDIRRYSKMECEQCTNTLWDYAFKHCFSITCNAPWRKDKCEKCTDKYWAGYECKDRLDCSAALLNDPERCTACAKEKHTSGSTMVVMTTGKCEMCPTNCLKCVPDKCHTCVSGYYATGNTCTACTTTVPTTAAQCGECPGKYWDSSGSTCKPCMANCKKCYDSTTCAECADTYIWDGRTGMKLCSDCMLNSATECQSCRETDRGKYYSNSKCYACPVGCVECSGTQVCTTCAPLYYREDDTANSYSYCKPCASIDKHDTRTKCTSCRSNHYWDESADFPCKECPQNCAACTTGGTCDKCRKNTMWFDTVIKACVERSSHCTANDNPGGCTACAANYLLVEKNCVAAIPGCVVYEGATSCKTCEVDRCYDDKKGACHKIDQRCDRCEMNDAGQVRCLTCLAYHYIHSCFTCNVDHCKVCSHNRLECVECSSGHYYNNRDKTCPACVTNCDFCLDNTKCKRCKPGYYIKDNTCETCGSWCTKCSTSQGCTECMAGYYKKSTDNQCKACGTGCAKCEQSGTTGTTCQACITGYWLKDGSCVKCVNYCTKCYNQTVCDACDASHYLDSAGICNECGLGFSHCAECDLGPNDTKPKCRKCQKTYSLKWDASKCESVKVDNCDNIKERPKRCVRGKCAGKLVPHNDTWEQCVDSCYNCSGYDCTHARSEHLIPCPDLGKTHFCAMSVKWDKKMVKVKRWCSPAPEPCPKLGEADVDECKLPYSMQQARECRRCCKDAGCNDWKVKDVDLARATSLSAPYWVLLTVLITCTVYARN